MAPADDIPVADDLDLAEVSPYRRRQKVVPVRRARFAGLHRVLRAVFLVTLVLGPSGYLVYRAVLFALNSPEFVLNANSVVLQGNRYVSSDEVLFALGLEAAWREGMTVNILSFSLDRARRQVEAIPWVRSAGIRRIYPNRLIVSVTERVPVAFVSIRGRLKLIDVDGVVLDRPERASFDFPVLSGLDSGATPADRKQRLALYQGFMRRVARDARTSGWMISEVDLSDPDDLKATVFRGSQTIELHLGHMDFEQRFQNFVSLLAQIGNGGAQVDSMDLRYGGQVVVNPKREAQRTYDLTNGGAVSRTPKE